MEREKGTKKRSGEEGRGSKGLYKSRLKRGKGLGDDECGRTGGRDLRPITGKQRSRQRIGGGKGKNDLGLGLDWAVFGRCMQFCLGGCATLQGVCQGSAGRVGTLTQLV